MDNDRRKTPNLGISHRGEGTAAPYHDKGRYVSARVHSLSELLKDEIDRLDCTVVGVYHDEVVVEAAKGRLPRGYLSWSSTPSDKDSPIRAAFMKAAQLGHSRLYTVEEANALAQWGGYVPPGPRAPMDGEQACAPCSGTGEVSVTVPWFGKMQQRQEKCICCLGSGVMTKEEVVAEVPKPGIADEIKEELRSKRVTQW
jgi:hypothetical protein